jgi:CheY-like chemotaxis protein
MVLVAHWSKPAADLLLSLLNGLSVSAACATTPPEATRLFELWKPDIVILGLNSEWVPLLQAFDSASPSPEIIVLTQSDELAQRARTMGLENVLIEDDPESLADGIAFFFRDWRAVSHRPDEVTLLVVDDEAEVRAAVSEYFSARGYTVLAAPNGKAALQEIERNPSIAVILVDVVMPDMGGVETLKELKMRNKHAGVIMMSGFADREIIRQAFKLGAFDVLPKPLTLSELEGDILACIASMEFRKNRWWKSLYRRLTRVAPPLINKSAAGK